MEKGQVGEGKIHIIILYRGEGKGHLPRKGGERDISGRKRDVSRKKIAEGIGIWREIN